MGANLKAEAQEKEDLSIRGTWDRQTERMQEIRLRIWIANHPDWRG
jgi:hypothetical protein